LWILGSSLFGAQLAAVLGLPYAFASHFAPDALIPALEVYRERYQPSPQWPKPYAMVGCGVIVADTDAEARHLFTSVQQRIIGMVRGARGLTQPPVDDIDSLWTPAEKAHAERMLACSFVGSAETVRRGLQKFVTQTKADELMVTCGVYDHAAKLRSYEKLAKEIAPALAKEPAAA
jgi:luciferase family oxidoreductase group 1